MRWPCAPPPAACQGTHQLAAGRLVCARHRGGELAAPRSVKGCIRAGWQRQGQQAREKHGCGTGGGTVGSAGVQSLVGGPRPPAMCIPTGFVPNCRRPGGAASCTCSGSMLCGPREGPGLTWRAVIRVEGRSTCRERIATGRRGGSEGPRGKEPGWASARGSAATRSLPTSTKHQRAARRGAAPTG